MHTGALYVHVSIELPMYTFVVCYNTILNITWKCLSESECVCFSEETIGIGGVLSLLWFQRR